MTSQRKQSKPVGQRQHGASVPPTHGEAGAAGTVQGEGDYRAAERYDQSARAFASSGKVDAATRRAQPADAAEARELREAEDRGLAHSKGEDPALPHASRGNAERR